MSEWRETQLRDVATIQQGFAFKSQDFFQEGEIPVIKIKNISSGKVDLTDVQYFNKDASKLSRYFASKGDILIAMTGSHLDQPSSVVGRVSLMRDNVRCLLNQRTAKILPSEDVDKDFLYYIMIQEDTLALLAGNATGSANQANISSEQIYNLPVLLPPLNEQRAIAEVLSSLDDKIDLLHRNNKTLEVMAMILFRERFIDTNKMTKVSEVFDVTMGQSPPGNTYNEDGNGIAFFQGRTDFTFRFPDERVYCTAPTRLAKQFDTLLSVRAPVGDVNLASKECCIGRGLAGIRFKDSNVHYSYTYNMFKYLHDAFDVHEQSGTVFGSISKDELFKLECPTPINLDDYYTVSTLEDKMTSNSFQIASLSKMRDSLLPKLMSGQVRVKDL